jgi:hypothetical protein
MIVSRGFGQIVFVVDLSDPFPSRKTNITKFGFRSIDNLLIPDLFTDPIEIFFLLREKPSYDFFNYTHL